jgi:hypothetical protein
MSAIGDEGSFVMFIATFLPNFTPTSVSNTFCNRTQQCFQVAGLNAIGAHEGTDNGVGQHLRGGGFSQPSRPNSSGHAATRSGQAAVHRVTAFRSAQCHWQNVRYVVPSTCHSQTPLRRKLSASGPQEHVGAPNGKMDPNGEFDKIVLIAYGMRYGA